MARPSTLTLEVQKRVCEVILAGNFRKVACAAAGVNPRTFRLWLTTGKRATQGPYRAFYDSVIAAEQQAEVLAVQRVMEAAAEDAKHAEWWLERKFPERWGRDRHEIGELRREVAELTARVNQLLGDAPLS